MKNKILTSLVIVVLSAFTFMGCTISLGEEVDKQVIFDAVDKTFESGSFDYDYDFQGRIMYKIAGEWGPWSDGEMNGNVKWNSDTNVSSNFLIKNESSGALLFNSNSYKYNIGNTVITDKVDETDFLIHKDVDGIYENELDTEMDLVNNLLLTLTEEDIDYIKYFDSVDEYHIGLNQTAVESLIARIVRVVRTGFNKDLTYLDIDKEMKFTLSDGYIKTVDFSISAETSAVEISFDFDQTFNAYSDVSITIPDYDGIIMGEDLVTELNVLDNMFDEDFNSQVDEGILSPSLGVDFRGTHINVVDNNTNYFNNYYELDSDYKPELEDNKISVALLDNSGVECWEEQFNVLSNSFTQLTEYNSETYAMFMAINFSDIIDNINFIYKEDDNNDTKYTMGVSNDYALILFGMLNTSLDFEIYKYKEDLMVEGISFEIVVSSGIIKLIDIKAQGTFIDTEDIAQDFEIELSYEIKTQEETDYTIPAIKEDIN